MKTIVKDTHWFILAKMFYELSQLPYSLSTSLLEVIFKSPLNKIFGETASALPLDVLKFEEDTNIFIIKVPKENYVKVRAALTFLTALNIGSKEIPVTISVIAASPSLLSLCSPLNKFQGELLS